MRYYGILIINRDGLVMVPNYNGRPGFTPVPYTDGLWSYTSMNAGMNQQQRGSTNPAALRVEMDIATTAQDAVCPNSFVRIHGVGLAEISQASNLNGAEVQVFGGMAAGLPLANPNQAGLLCSGQIVQAFGNWIGVDQTLEFYVGASGSSPDSSQVTGVPGTTLAPTTNSTPAGFVFQWAAGQPLMVPLVNCLSQVFPQYAIVGAVHPGLVWSGATTTGYYKTLPQLAQWISQKSISMISGYAPPVVPGPDTYSGVSIILFNNTIIISDGTTQTLPLQIQFQEIVGQPTWSQTNTVQTACVMRADVQVGDYVTLPDLPGITQQGSFNQFFNPNPFGNGYSDQKSGTIFTGTFMVTAVRHVGDSRDPGATSWVTTIDMKLASTPMYPPSPLPFVYQPSAAGNKYGFTLNTASGAKYGFSV